MKKEYSLNKVFVCDVDTVIKNVVPSIYPGWDRMTTLSCKPEGYKIVVEENNEYIDLNSLSKVYDSNNISDTISCKNGDLIISRKNKKVPFLKFIENSGIKYSEKSATREQIFGLFDEVITKIKDGYTNTLAIIKPDGMSHLDKIIEMLYKDGLKIKDYKIETLSEELIEKHYSHLLDKPFYPKLKEYMMSAPVAIMILEGYDAVNKLRELMGPTDATKADSNTIRGKFGTNITYNAIHGSDSNENAKIEIDRFFHQKKKVK